MHFFFKDLIIEKHKYNDINKLSKQSKLTTKKPNKASIHLPQVKIVEIHTTKVQEENYKTTTTRLSMFRNREIKKMQHNKVHTTQTIQTKHRQQSK